MRWEIITDGDGWEKVEDDREEDLKEQQDRILNQFNKRTSKKISSKNKENKAIEIIKTEKKTIDKKQANKEVEF